MLMTQLLAANPQFQDNMKQKVWVELAQTPHSHVEMQSRCARATAESELYCASACAQEGCSVGCLSCPLVLGGYIRFVAS